MACCNAWSRLPASQRAGRRAGTALLLRGAEQTTVATRPRQQQPPAATQGATGGSVEPRGARGAAAAVQPRSSWPLAGASTRTFYRRTELPDWGAAASAEYRVDAQQGHGFVARIAGAGI